MANDRVEGGMKDDIVKSLLAMHEVSCVYHFEYHGEVEGEMEKYNKKMELLRSLAEQFDVGSEMKDVFVDG